MPKNALDSGSRGRRGFEGVETDRKAHYSQPEIVAFYATAAAEVGLWRSEERLLPSLFAPEAVLLNVGAGAGRVSFGLWELGYHQVLGVDFARPMVEEARLLASKLEYATPFRVGDVSRLGFDAGAFDGVIWTAAGIADLAGPEARATAMKELRRVAKSGGLALITTPLAADESMDAFAALLASTGWEVTRTAARAAVADEPDDVTRRYPDVTFWVLKAV